MKNVQKVFAIVTLGLFACGVGIVAAQVEQISGHVTEVSADKGRFSVQTMTPTTGESKKNDFKTTDKSQFQGASSLKDVVVGDVVRVEAEKKTVGAWKVNTLYKTSGGMAGSMGNTTASPTYTGTGNSASSTGTGYTGTTGTSNSDTGAGTSTDYTGAGTSTGYTGAGTSNSDTGAGTSTGYTGAGTPADSGPTSSGSTTEPTGATSSSTDTGSTSGY